MIDIDAARTRLFIIRRTSITRAHTRETKNVKNIQHHRTGGQQRANNTQSPRIKFLEILKQKNFDQSELIIFFSKW